MRTHLSAAAFSPRRPRLARAVGALLAIGAMAAIPIAALAGVYVSVNIAPPILPVYAQPIIPGPGYLWTPGYWAWAGDGYYWVPGTWIRPPFVGELWTPGYWGWNGGAYIFHRGYWGRHVGFYGGINYGYGYGGNGYEGGYWRGGGFYYNRSVNHVGGNIRNVYNKTVINHTTIIDNRRTSFNGGPRGIAARATPQQLAWSGEQHTAPIAAQLRQRDMASHVQSLRASVNHGAPPIAATARAGDFNDHGELAAHGASTAMTPAAVRQAHSASATTPRHDARIRSAGFAPHGAQSTRSGNASRYQAPKRQPSHARAEQTPLSRRGASRVDRSAVAQPQNTQRQRARPRIDRQGPNQAGGAYHPADTRAAASRASGAHTRAAPKVRETRKDAQH